MSSDARMNGDLAIKPARLASRILGLVIDAILCTGVFVVGLAANELAISLLLDDSGNIWDRLWLWLVCPAIIGYFTLSFAGGQSLGMKAASTRLAHSQTRERPGLLLAIPRATLAFSLLAAPVMLAGLSFEGTTPDFTGAGLVELGLPVMLLLLNLINYLWMLLDREHQTFLDRRLNIVMLEARVTTPGNNNVAISHV